VFPAFPAVPVASSRSAALTDPVLDVLLLAGEEVVHDVDDVALRVGEGGKGAKAKDSVREKVPRISCGHE
jgi:hypothetical protein